jgi:hypothetical protein
MLTIENKHTLINETIVLNVVKPGLSKTYYVYNTWGWNQEGNEQYHFHIRHIHKLHSDIKIVLNRFKTGNGIGAGYILWNEDTPINSMLLSSEQIRSKETFLYCIERVMVMK